MKKRQKIKQIRKLKKKFFLAICGSFFIIFFLLVLLNSYLFEIQKEERLSKKSDFKNYKITYIKENRCQKKERIKKENISYIFDCLDMVYVTFGTTKITLEEAIEKNYLDLATLLENTTLIGKEENASIYEKKPKKEEDPYLIKILEEEKTIVTISPKEKNSKSK